MPEGTTPASVQRFASDLRRIREARTLSLGDLHEETKIPTGLLEAFETNALIDHEMFNRVYLRSLVRTYAQVVGVDPEMAQEALEEALDDRYEGRLAQAYLGEKPPAPQPKPAEAPPPSVDAGRSPEVVTPEAAPPGPSEKPAPETPPPSRKKPAAPEKATSTAPAVASATQPDTVSPPGGRVPERTAQRAARRPPERSDSSLRTWLYGALGLAALAAITWLVLSLLNTPGEPEPVATPEPPARDTVAVAPTPAAPERPTVVLGDTLFATVVAAQGPITGIRITRDGDIRRPYWIDTGRATVFPFTQRIVLEETAQLDRMRLLLAGYAYPTSERDERGRIVITRDDAEVFTQTLQGSPVALSVRPDTQWVAVPRTP